MNGEGSVLKRGNKYYIISNKIKYFFYKEKKNLQTSINKAYLLADFFSPLFLFKIRLYFTSLSIAISHQQCFVVLSRRTMSLSSRSRVFRTSQTNYSSNAKKSSCPEAAGLLRQLKETFSSVLCLRPSRTSCVWVHCFVLCRHCFISRLYCFISRIHFYIKLQFSVRFLWKKAILNWLLNCFFF